MDLGFCTHLVIAHKPGNSTHKYPVFTVWLDIHFVYFHTYPKPYCCAKEGNCEKETETDQISTEREG